MAKKALGKGLSSIFEDLGTPIATESGELTHNIALSEITPNPFQPRKEFSEANIQELADSISQKGLLQPILLRKHQNQYQIIAGERRFRASQKLGLKTVKSLIRERVSDRDMMELSIIENIQRVQLNPIEEAQSYHQLIEKCGLTHEDLSARLGKSRSAVTNTIRLLKLNSEVRKLIANGTLSAGHARALLKFPPEQQLEMAQKIIEGNLNVRKTEGLNSGRKSPLPKKPMDANLRAVVDKMKYYLGSKVEVSGSENKGKLIIQYHSKSELQSIFDIIEEGAGPKH